MTYLGNSRVPKPGFRTAVPGTRFFSILKFYNYYILLSRLDNTVQVYKEEKDRKQLYKWDYTIDATYFTRLINYKKLIWFWDNAYLQGIYVHFKDVFDFFHHFCCNFFSIRFFYRISYTIIKGLLIYLDKIN